MFIKLKVMKAIIIYTLCVLMLGCLPLSAGDNDSEMSAQGNVGKEEIVSIALGYMGLDSLAKGKDYDIGDVSLCKLEKENTPFVAGKIKGRKVWKIEFKKVKYGWVTNPRLVYYRNFEVLMDPQRGQFLRIYSLDKHAGVSDTLPEPPYDVSEGKMKENFGKLVEVRPVHGFVYALSQCLLANPSRAKVIRAILIETKVTGREKKVPAWYIVMRGHEDQSPMVGPPPIKGRPRGPYKLPACALRTYRMVVNADTGRLEGTNVE